MIKLPEKAKKYLVKNLKNIHYHHEYNNILTEITRKIELGNKITNKDTVILSYLQDTNMQINILLCCILFLKMLLMKVKNPEIGTVWLVKQ